MTIAFILKLKRKPIIIVAFWFLGIQVLAQPYKTRENWYLGLQSGAVSFFGDLSVHDFDPIRKITKESDFAWGFTAGKSINRIIDARIHYNHGHMRGSNPNLDMYFNSNFNEFSVGAAINLSRIIKPFKISGVDFAATAGLGINLYRSIKYKISDGSYLSSEGFYQNQKNKGNANSAFVIPLGAELNYHPKPNWMITLGFSFRMHNQDLLDSHIGSTGISDHYSVLSVGCYYILNPIKKKPKQRIPGVPESF